MIRAKEILIQAITFPFYDINSRIKLVLLFFTFMYFKYETKTKYMGVKMQKKQNKPDFTQIFKNNPSGLLSALFD